MGTLAIIGAMVGTLQGGLYRAIQAMFAAGEKGVVYDPSDLTTLYQDSAGTTPVTAVGQPVGLMLDKSGNGAHATQSTSTARPVLEQDANGKFYLKFDGVDDFMVTPSIDFSGTDKMSVWAGVRKLSDAARGMLVELSTSVVNAGAFAVDQVPPAYRIFGVSNSGNGISTLTPAAPTTRVLTAQWANTVISLRENSLSAFTGTQVSANFGNYPLYIGMRAGTSLPFNGHLYSLVVRGALSDAAQITAAEAYAASKAGITL